MYFICNSLSELKFFSCDLVSFFSRIANVKLALNAAYNRLLVDLVYIYEHDLSIECGARNYFSIWTKTNGQN